MLGILIVHCLVAMPFVTSSFLLLVAMPGAPRVAMPLLLV